MWPRFLRSALLAAVLALAPACEELGSAPQVQLVTTACLGTPPLEGVTHLRLRVTGEGLDTPIERVTPVELRPGDIPVVPPGPKRVLEIRGHMGEPTSAGRAVSVGRSLPFDMPEQGAPLAPVRVILRRIEAFIPLESAQQRGSCLELTEPRAGHTASLLPDGRVLVAGGFKVGEGGAFETLSSIEILDPMTGTLTYLPNPGDGAARRAFHTASVMIDERVALLGGEVHSLGVATPLRTGAVFDPLTGSTFQFNLAAARSRHAAAIDLSGRILIVGGVGEGGAVVSAPEGVEASARRSFGVPTAVPREGASVVAFMNGQRIAVIGGAEEGALAKDVLVFGFNGTTFSLMGPTVPLRHARRDAAVAPYDVGRLLVLGGYAEATVVDSTRTVSSSEVLSLETDTPGVSTGPSIVDRGDLCAAALSRGRVFTAGGRRLGQAGLLASSGSVEVITPSTNVTGGVLGMSPLQPARYLHTCTSLPDGSVLVAGGLDTTGDTPQLALGTYVFMPVPRD